MTDSTLQMNDGRTVGFADYGRQDQIAVLWCHGGPGNRFEPALLADAASRAGLRLIGIDRPGYGRSTAQPGRTIGGWVPDAIAVADRLGVDRFVVAGMSTGGAYALALAAHTSRVIAAVACGAVSDMRWPEGKAMNVCCHPFWYARSRDEALALAITTFGEHGKLLLPPHGPVASSQSDSAFIAIPAVQSWWSSCVAEMFPHGMAGYVDDRIADANGWGSFDVASIGCPVTVLHGGADGLMPVANAHHTAAIVPGSAVRIVEHLGHFGILDEVVETIGQTLAQTSAKRAAMR
jgi:pimeloyl-ACP methyl ester carboxylesterase